MIVYAPNLTPAEILERMPGPVNARLSEIAAGCLRLEKMAEPIEWEGYWKLTYNFTLLPPMIGEGI